MFHVKLSYRFCALARAVPGSSGAKRPWENYLSGRWEM